MDTSSGEIHGRVVARLAAYSATAGAVLLAGRPVLGAMVYVDLEPDVSRGYNSEFALDLDGDGVDDVSLVIEQSNYAYGGYRSSQRQMLIAAASGNALLVSSVSAPLGSNYLVSSLAPGWLSGRNQLAYFASYKAPGYPAYVDSGGPWLGAANKFVGIRFMIGADAHYGWIRMSVTGKVQGFTVSDYAYEDVPDAPVVTGAWLPPGGDGTAGSALALAATDLDPGLAAFTRRPKVTGRYYDPLRVGRPKRTVVGVVTRIAKDVPPPAAVRCEWRMAVRLYHPRGLAAAYARGETAEDFLLANPMGTVNAAIQVQAKEGGQTYLADVFQYRIAPPAIADVTDLADNPLAAAALGAVLKVHGDRFGKRAPRAWLEHVVAGRTRRLALKALRPYEFADAAGKPNASCMDPDTGASVLLLQMPVKWPSGWVHGDHDLVLDNRVGLAVFPFATAP